MATHMLKAQDVAKILNVSENMGYRVIRELNLELQEKGFRVVRGRVPYDFLTARYRIDDYAKTEV